MTLVASQQVAELENKHLIIQPNTNVETVQTLVDWITASEWMCMEDSSSFDFPNFPEKNEVFQVFYSKVNDKEISKLFRTVLALGGFTSRLIEYQKEKDLFVFRLYQSQEPELLAKLEWLQAYIEKELRFKKVMSRLIANEKKYQAEERLLRRELF